MLLGLAVTTAVPAVTAASSAVATASPAVLAAAAAPADVTVRRFFLSSILRRSKEGKRLFDRTAAVGERIGAAF